MTARAEVEEGQQDLRRAQAASAEQLVVGPVEASLPDRARRLQLFDGHGADRELEQAHAARDRSRGDDDDVDAGPVQRGDLVADALDHLEAQLARILGEHRGTQLHHRHRHAERP